MGGYSRYTDHSYGPRGIAGKRDICAVKRYKVEKARRAIYDVSKHRENQRKYYYANLIACIENLPHKEAEAAELQFSQQHFLDQVRYTHEEMLAEKEEEMYHQQAKEVHAYHEDELTSDFGDWASDGNDDSGFRPDCPVWRLQKHRIAKWAEAERERLGLNDAGPVKCTEDDWIVQDPVTEPGGRTLLPLGDGIEPHAEDLFEGQWRRKIDDWRHKQDKIRAQPKLGTLYWWQEVTGI